jgi:hypothetical protein
LSNRVTYLDASALVKLATRERETGALRRYVHTRPTLASSALVRTEVIRAVRPQGVGALRRARAVLDRLRLVTVDDELLEAAGVLEPWSLRTLDAIHLATMLTFADTLEAVVTYDAKQRAAVEMFGLPVVAPAWT